MNTTRTLTQRSNTKENTNERHKSTHTTYKLIVATTTAAAKSAANTQMNVTKTLAQPKEATQKRTTENALPTD
jgi:hypothetical protein